MKKLGLLLLILVVATPLYGQGIQMHVQLKNGQVRTYQIDSVVYFKMSPIDSPNYHRMNFWADFIDFPAPRAIDPDSVTFGLDGYNEVSMAPWRNGGVDKLIYHFGGPPVDIHSISKLDSITFSSYSINTRVVRLPSQYWDPQTQSNEFGNYTAAVWSGNHIYCTYPSRVFTVDDDVNVSGGALFDTSRQGPTGEWAFSTNDAGDRLLSVKTIAYPASMGTLIENNLHAGGYEKLTSIPNVSSAVYFPRTNNIVYYTYGSYSTTPPNTHPADAGYFLLDRSTNISTSLLSYISDMGPAESINGFDISPDGKRLLLANARASQMPLIIEYDLATHVRDTLATPFDPKLGNVCLWVRYSHDGKSILYSNYPAGVVRGGKASQPSEVGIIDRKTRAKQILNVAPDTQLTYISLFPQWSPDDSKIVYLSTYISTEPKGYVGSFDVKILKSVK